MLSKFSVKKPLTVVVSVVLVIILGIISFTSMTTDLLPKMDLPFVVVMTTYPGASPEKVEAAITKPLEQAIATTNGIENINSVSRENSSMIMIEFNQGTNMDSAMIDLNGKIDLVKSNLDEAAGSPMLMKMNPDMIPIMIASVDVDGLSIEETSKIVKNEVIPTFERLEGVASVNGTGLLEEKIQVTLDADKIEGINNKVLATIDSTLSESKAKLDEANKKVQEGKELLSKESAEKIAQLVDGSFALGDGKDKIQSALNNLPELQKELGSKKEQLIPLRDALAWVIKQQEENNLPVSEEEKQAFEQLENGIKSIDEGLEAIKTQKPTLESSLNEIVDNQKKLEIGKITLTQELTKASVALTNSEAELKKANEEFEKARDEAYKKAGVTSALTKDTLSKLLMAQNFSMPAGYITEGEEQYLLKVGDKFTSIDDLKNAPLINLDVVDIGEVTIDDVANVELINNADDMYAKVNGNDAIILSFQKQSTASTSEVSDNINEAIEKLVTENTDMHIVPLQDQGVYINIVIDSVLNNLVLGGILAVVILFIFLKNIRPTIIIAFSIPISLLFAIVMMYFSGVTMNIISLAGLALGVGMLVDNSIVVIENIYRLRNEGMSAIKAAVKGATQVTGAIAASTLTTICVFLPIVFTQGISRQLFTDMGLTIAYSLIASLIIALTLVPTMSATILKDSKEKEHKLFDKMVNAYEKVLILSLKHKAVVLIGAVVVLITSAILTISKGAILMPESDSVQVSVSMEMPKGTTTQDAREMSNIILDRVTSLDDVETVGALQSGKGELIMGGGSTGNISFYVLLKEDKKLSSKEVGKLIEEKTSDLDCEVKINTQTMDMSSLGGSGVDVIIKGNDLDELKRIGKDVSNIISEIDGTTEINNGLDEAVMETHIKVDKNKAMTYGLTVAQVYQDIAMALQNETTSTSLTVGANEYPVILVNDSKNELKKDTLSNYNLKVTKDGSEEEIALTDIATISEEESLTSIKRDNQVRYLSVTAKVDTAHNTGLISNEVESKLKDYNFPEGYSYKMGGEKESMDSAFSDLIKMIVLAILLIYLIMVAQFQSFLSPFIVLFTIPLAFTGGFLGLLLTGFNISMISMLGFLILAGIVVNNGIVFVDYANQLRLEGMDKKEALIVTGRTRIRPILMTALTTILGLSTLALGIGMGADMIQPMAIVTIGGLTYATILTLFIIPVMYDIFHKKELKATIIEEDELCAE